MSNRIDWTFIKPLYEAGTLSIRELARQYSDRYSDQDQFKTSVTDTAIRKQAKLKGWSRRLADKIRERAAEKLVRAEFAPATRGKTTDQIDEETIEAGADLMLAIMRRHRIELARLTQIEEILISQLIDDVNQVVIGWHLGEPTEHNIKLGTLDRARATKALNEAVSKRILTERVATGIDKVKPDIDGPDKVEVIQYFGEPKK